jgi:hypothetical protein
MLRDSLVGLIEPMFSSAGTYPLALSTECLSDHPKPATDYHLKTGQRE